MTEGAGDRCDHASVMASWSESSSPPNEAAPPNGTRAATAVERARRLLKQLCSERPRDDQAPLRKQ
jgi:hypothetical protein